MVDTRKEGQRAVEREQSPLGLASTLRQVRDALKENAEPSGNVDRETEPQL
ncbi:hypothetical protein [Rhizobium sp. Root149]|uniref:hypothetical protein n=1 Tax=Rhizobium sp. Root149 TaxID=1736473 RepID=UPI000AB3C31F|nr:hypothetical protein [Rhizobium sp. Root149]